MGKKALPENILFGKGYDINLLFVIHFHNFRRK